VFRRLPYALLLLVVVGLPVLAEEKGPNGGVLYQAAKHKYHIEIVVDAAKKSVTAYILDDKAKNAVPIKAKTISLKMKGAKEPITLKGAAAKDSDSYTKYEGTGDALGGKLDFAGITIVAKVADDKSALTFELDD
jgi:hypothetical protein